MAHHPCPVILAPWSLHLIPCPIIPITPQGRKPPEEPPYAKTFNGELTSEVVDLRLPPQPHAGSSLVVPEPSHGTAAREAMSRAWVEHVRLLQLGSHIWLATLEKEASCGRTAGSHCAGCCCAGSSSFLLLLLLPLLLHACSDCVSSARPPLYICEKGDGY